MSATGAYVEGRVGASAKLHAVPGMNPLQFRPDAGADLLRIEDCLLRSVRADDTLLTEIASHLIPAGGKRLRPSFVAASALLGAPDPLVPAALTDDIVRGSVSVELVHLGSLYHDDVMDDAETRHGVDSVNFRWGNLRAILAGDFLLARASEIAASLGTDVAALLAATIGWLCEGQVRELERMFDVSRSEESYLDAINGKTAALYSTACRIGALVSDLPADTTDRLSDFGQAYGMAFQIVDDIHDLRSTAAEMGKPVGNDIRAGVYTLPVIRTLADDPDGELAGLLGRPLDDAEQARAKELVLGGPHIASSVASAVDYIEEATALLDSLPVAASVDGLRSAAKNLLSSLPG